MSHDFDLTRPIPSLVQYCQRVASAHSDSIHSLGGDLRFELVKPILQNCSADTLLRLEQDSPHFKHETTEMWKALCFRSYPLAAEQRNSNEEPESWRDEYYALRALEAKRLEEVGSRLRSQREEAAQRKKESQIKLTDRLPPTKRGRWGQPQPKTLFQKTRSDAVKMHKGIYSARMIPPMPAAKTYRVIPGAPSAKISPPPPSPSAGSSASSGSRVTVQAVAVQRPVKASVSSTSSTSTGASRPQAPIGPTATESASLPASTKSTPAQTIPQTEVRSSPPRPLHSKKDPMKSLFMPKHRAFSQLPTRPSPSIRPPS